MSEGKKFDNGKERYDLVPVEAHEALAKVFTYGAKKYDDNNWQQVESNRYEAALFRHLNAWRKGEKYDSESNLHHLAHALTNVAILLWKDINDCNAVLDINTGITHKDLDEMEKEFNTSNYFL